jgi:single-strand DNA-binding protein
VTLIGNLGSDPDVRTTQGGTVVCRLSIATNEQIKNKAGEWESHTEWHRVTVFGKQAENAGKFLRKGARAHVFGHLRTNKWTDADGVERWTTEIVADRLTFLDRAERQDRPPVDSYDRAVGSSAGASSGTSSGASAHDLDDVPF